MYRGHFDVRPGNVLVVSNGAEVTDWLFKFADFGSSNSKSKDPLSKENETKDASIYGKYTTISICVVANAVFRSS